MIDLQSLGKRIQSARAERGFTLQDLAAGCSVSVSMLSAVERGTKAPTVLVLGRIADGLGLPLAELVDEPGARRVVLRRAAEQDTADEPGGWRRTILTPVVPGVNFEWIYSELPPGCDAGMYPAYAPGSHEWVAVTTGALRLTVGTEVLRLGAGDSVYFASDEPHGYANDGADWCRYHVAALDMRSRRPGPVRPRSRQ